MDYTLTTDAQTGMHALGGELSIYTVAEIRNNLLALLADTSTLHIDLAGVTDIDTAGLQLMLLTKRAPDKEVRFCNHSAAVLRLVDLANLGQTLGDPLFISARSDG